MAMAKKQIPGQQNLAQYTLPQVSVRLRLEEERALYSSTPLDSRESAVSVMQDLMKSLDREMVCVCNLDTHLRAINYNVCSICGLDYSVVEIANVFKSGILTANCKSILLFHNHPSWITSPSSQDVEIIRRVSQAGALLGIPMQDHIIIGGGVGADPPYSFREHFPEYFSGVYDPDYIEKMLVEPNGICKIGETIPGEAALSGAAMDDDNDEELIPALSRGRSR